MPQSLSHILIHVIFSTHQRTPWITPEIRSDLHAFLAGVAREAGHECPRVGGVADHVHLAVRLSRTVTIAQLVEDLKTSSSKWMKKRTPESADFTWQRGYGAFSVSPSDADKLFAYIDNQEEHHRTKSFQEEFRMFCQKYSLPLDERYVWD